MSRVLVLNPYAGGSHRDFVAGWRGCSDHELEVIELPGRHWKWRMRHAAWTLAQRAAALEGVFDAVWATDMMDLAAWRGLAPAAIGRLPHAVYMHETQLAYPDAHKSERDLHFAFTNLLSAAAADAVLWNSAFHRDLFCDHMGALLERMPDYAPESALERVRAANARRARVGAALAGPVAGSPSPAPGSGAGIVPRDATPTRPVLGTRSSVDPEVRSAVIATSRRGGGPAS